MVASLEPSATSESGEPVLSYGEDFVFTLFTSDPELARRADRAGINRIGLDLEKLGKDYRQGHTPGWISDHQVADLAGIRQALNHGQLFARTNGMHPGSKDEIELLLATGVQVLMLPFFRTCSEVEDFIRLIDGRAQVSLLLETASAMARVHEIVKIEGIDEIHVGLNDLHLDLKLHNHFEVLVSGIMDMLSDTIRGAGIAFGFGGVARRDDKKLPIDPNLIYSQYPRLGADRALITRAYVGPDSSRLDLNAELQITRQALDEWAWRPVRDLEAARDELRRSVSGWQV